MLSTHNATPPSRCPRRSTTRQGCVLPSIDTRTFCFVTSMRAPLRAPQANGIAERFVRTARSECFDRLLILNQQHLERILEVFADHYNGHRPHRALSLVPPEPRRPAATALAAGAARILRRDRLGGVVHEYVPAA